MQRILSTAVILSLVCLRVTPAADEYNYDEAKVPQYELPDLLVDPDGHKVETADTWTSSARAKWMKVVADEVYGHAPNESVNLTIVDTSTKTTGEIKRKQVTLRCSRRDKSIDMHLLLDFQVSLQIY